MDIWCMTVSIANKWWKDGFFSSAAGETIGISYGKKNENGPVSYITYKNH